MRLSCVSDAICRDKIIPTQQTGSCFWGHSRLFRNALRTEKAAVQKKKSRGLSLLSTKEASGVPRVDAARDLTDKKVTNESGTRPLPCTMYIQVRHLDISMM